MNRVLVSEGESLSYASPKYMDVVNVENTGAPSTKARNQRKGDPMPLASCALAKGGFLAAPLRAVPDKNASARRGIRGFPANSVT